MKTRLSSAKRRWAIVIFLANLRPLICCLFRACTKRLEKVSAHMMKRYGDKGHHCLKPISGTIKFFGISFIIMENETVDTQFIINFIHL